MGGQAQRRLWFAIAHAAAEVAMDVEVAAGAARALFAPRDAAKLGVHRCLYGFVAQHSHLLSLTEFQRERYVHGHHDFLDMRVLAMPAIEEGKQFAWPRVTAVHLWPWRAGRGP